MSNYYIQREREINAWDEFKKAVNNCMSLSFNERQLTSYIQIQYYDDCDINGIKGVVKGEVE